MIDSIAKIGWPVQPRAVRYACATNGQVCETNEYGVQVVGTHTFVQVFCGSCDVERHVVGEPGYNANHPQPHAFPSTDVEFVEELVKGGTQ